MRTKRNPESRPLVPTKHPGIYKRGGRYVVRFRDHHGKQRQKSARTMREARAIQAETRGDLSKGHYRNVSREPFVRYAEQWVDNYKGRTGRGIRPETLHEYRRDLKRAMAYFGTTPLSLIEPRMVNDFLNDHLVAEGLAAATRRRIAAPLKALFSSAVVNGDLRDSPAKEVRIIGDARVGGRSARKYLERDEVARVVAATPEGWKRTFVTTLALTGIRKSEALGLTWGAVMLDKKGGTISIYQRVRYGRVGDVKTENAAREVPFGATLAKLLREHRMASPFSTDADYVFPTETGRAQGEGNVYRWYKPVAAAAGVEWSAFHHLRHAAGNLWIEEGGISVQQVSDLLGHHSISFTMKVYGHALAANRPTGDALAEAIGL
jgi:integrase